MTWHLKDRELEKKLIAIKPDFVETLTDAVEEMTTNNWFNKDSVTEVELTYNGDYLGMVAFLTHELEETHKYNPHDWNDYPEVIPPKGIPMQVETKMGFGYKATFKYGKWLDNGNDAVDVYYGDVIRFRPWEN